MKILAIISIFLSMILMFMNHPMMIMTMVLTQTMIIAMVYMIAAKTSWISFILFLILIGGLMILFIYITSLASNETFQFNWNNMKNYIFMSFLIMLLMMIFSFLSNQSLMGYKMMTSQIFMMFTQPVLWASALVMTYLLITLIVIVTIAKKMDGPLRNLIKK